MNVNKTPTTWSTGGVGGKSAGAVDGERKWPVQPGTNLQSTVTVSTDSFSTTTSTSTKVNLTGK